MLEQLQCNQYRVDPQPQWRKHECIVAVREEEHDEYVECELEEREDECVVAHHVEGEGEEPPVVQVALEGPHAHEPAIDKPHRVHACKVAEPLNHEVGQAVVLLPEGPEVGGVRVDRGHEQKVEEEAQGGGRHEVHETHG